MFDGGPPYTKLHYGLNNSWYVTFENEEATQRAFLHLQSLGKTFNNKPICVSYLHPNTLLFYSTFQKKYISLFKIVIYLIFLN